MIKVADKMVEREKKKREGPTHLFLVRFSQVIVIRAKKDKHFVWRTKAWKENGIWFSRYNDDGGGGRGTT